MIDALVIHGSDAATWVDDVYITGAVWTATMIVLAATAYSIVASKPDWEALPIVVMGGVVVTLAWPLVVCVGCVAGLRKIVHGPGIRVFSRYERRQARIRALEAENERLEHELGLRDG